MKVFLSSTYLDLIEHRKAVVQALRTMGEEVESMEIFGARDEESTGTSLKELDICEVLVGVYAYRYGTVPKGTNTSVTEKEYLHATMKNIPILVFVVDENHSWPPKSMDKSLTKIDKFKNKAKAEHAPSYFTTPDNLAKEVVSSIGRLAKKFIPKLAFDASSSLPYASPKPKGSTLPIQPYFFGREKELAIIADAISPESRTWGAIIDGPGGIGKSALAIRAAHLAPETLFGQKIFITSKIRELTPSGEKSLEDFTRPNYLAMLNELALELGESSIPRLAPDERSNALRLVLSNKKTLIIFDNLETLSEDERARLFQFLGRLPAGNKAIVTSRRRSDVDARVMRLDRLSIHDALQLISELAKDNSKLALTTENDRRNLYEITNGNPLFIRWVAGQLGREGSQCRSIAEAFDFIEKAPKGNDPLEYIFGDLLETFSEHETIVLAALSHFTAPAKLMWITEMTNLPENICETAMEDLADRSVLISSPEVREFYLPPLTTHFIKTRRPEAVQQTGDKLADRAFALAMQYRGGGKNYEGFDAMDTEWLSIVSAIPSLLAGENKRLQSFSDALFQYFNFAGLWDEAIELNLQAEQKALVAKDNINAGWRAYQTGWIYYLRGQSTKVLSYATRAQNHWKNAGSREISMAIRLRGLGYELEKDYPNAIEAYREVLSLRRTINPESDDVAIALTDLASAQRQYGEFVVAERNYEEALRIDKKNNSQEGIAIYTGNMAMLALSRKRWSEAEKHAREALELGEKVGRQDLIASSLSQLSIAVARQNRPVEGTSYALRAIEIYTRLRSPDLKVPQEALNECERIIQLETDEKQRKANEKQKRARKH